MSGTRKSRTSNAPKKIKGKGYEKVFRQKDDKNRKTNTSTPRRPLFYEYSSNPKPSRRKQSRFLGSREPKQVKGHLGRSQRARMLTE